jgi:hypothetical protein
MEETMLFILSRSDLREVRCQTHIAQNWLGAPQLGTGMVVDGWLLPNFSWWLRKNEKLTDQSGTSTPP